MSGNPRSRSNWKTRDAASTELHLYCMEYNWFGEEGKIYRHAVSLKQGWRTFCRQLAKKYDTTEARVWYHLREANRAKVYEVFKND